MRVRTKECYHCKSLNKVLYRCRYGDLKSYVFLCVSCLKEIKLGFKDTYQYGGTWKSKRSNLNQKESPNAQYFCFSGITPLTPPLGFGVSPCLLGII